MIILHVSLNFFCPFASLSNNLSNRSMKHLIQLALVILLILPFTSRAQEFYWLHDTGNWSGVGNNIFEIEPDSNILIANLLHGRYSVKRLDAEGNTLQFSQSSSTLLSNSGILDMAISDDHKIYLVGSFKDSMDIGLDGTTTMVYNSFEYGAFIAVYDSALSLLWHSTLNTTNRATIREIDLVDENFVIHGYYLGTIDLDFGPGQYLQSSGGNFVASYDTSGALNWTQEVSTTEVHVGIDHDANVYIAGYFVSSMTMYGSNQNLSLSNGTDEAFLGKYSPSGDALWLKQIGGSGISVLKSFDIDENDNPVVGMYFSLDLNFNTDDTLHTFFPTTVSTCRNLAWARYRPDGSVINAFATENITATDSRFRDIIAVGEAVYIAGYFRGTFDFAMGEGSSTKTAYSTTEDAYVARYDTNGVISWTNTVGQTALDMYNRVRTFSDDQVIVSGMVSAPQFSDFDPNPNVTVSGTSFANAPRVIVKYGDCGAVTVFDSDTICQGDSILIGGDYYYDSTTVYVYDNQWGECSYLDITDISVNPAPQGSLSSNLFYLCVGDSFQLSATIDSLNDPTYSISYDGAVSNFIDTTFDGENSQIVLTIQDTNGCMNYDYCALILEHPDTSSLQSVWLSDSTIEVTLTTNAADPGMLTWNFGDGTLYSDSGLTQTHTYSDSGNFTICVTGLDCDVIEACRTDSIPFPLGVLDQKYQLHLFPNPATDRLNLKGFVGPSSYRWYALDGRVVLQGASANSQALPTPASSGMYLLIIDDMSGTIHRQQVVVERR